MATASRSLCHSATKLVHQGAGKAQKMKPEASLAKKWSARCACFIPQEEVTFSVYNPSIMIVIVQCAYYVLVPILKIIVKWQL